MCHKKMGFVVKIFSAICIFAFLATSINTYCFTPNENGCENQPAQQSFLNENITQEDFQKTLCQLKEIYGEEFYNDITKITISQNISDHQHKISFLQLESWEPFSSLKLEEIDKILTEYFNLYPSTWTLKIKGVIFEAQDQKPKSVKNPGPNDWVGGLVIFDPSDNLWKIYIYPVILRRSARHNPSELCETFSHEIAHINDWKSINMTPEKKLIFFQKIAERFNAEDHYANMDYYLNNISLNTPQQTAYRQIVEYWAVISEAYLEERRGLSAKDADLVKSIIQYTELQFIDAKQKSKEQRRKLLDKIFYDQ
ncbi:MAG: hypothetical protein AAB824_01920 [Patescibacteria group bacterium]